jgi:hypothetical protein
MAKNSSLNPQPKTWPCCSRCGVAYVLRRALMFGHTAGSGKASLDIEWLWQRDCKHRKDPAKVAGSVLGEAKRQTRKRKP